MPRYKNAQWQNGTRVFIDWYCEAVNFVEAEGDYRPDQQRFFINTSVVIDFLLDVADLDPTPVSDVECHISDYVLPCVGPDTRNRVPIRTIEAELRRVQMLLERVRRAGFVPDSKKKRGRKRDPDVWKRNDDIFKILEQNADTSTNEICNRFPGITASLARRLKSDWKKKQSEDASGLSDS